MPLTTDRNTYQRDGIDFPVPVAANAVIHAGALVAANATGFAVPGAVATTLTALGRAEHAVDNTGGANGAKTLTVRRGKSFAFANDATNPVTQADLGKTCYIVDDETVSSLSTGRSAAGKVLGVEDGAVWVWIG